MILATYLVLFLLLGAVLLPLKAVVMNVLSAGAAFGVIVWGIQEGHLAGLLGFTPQTIDPGIAVLIFAILFGLSMDYEVLMLTRIQEEHRRTGDTRNGRLISGAAAIMVAVFACFGFGADVVLLKTLGLGLAVAVTVDATVVRSLVVPALRCLLGDLNWWAPAPLARLHRWLRLNVEPAAPGTDPLTTAAPGQRKAGDDPALAWVEPAAGAA